MTISARAAAAFLFLSLGANASAQLPETWLGISGFSSVGGTGGILHVDSGTGALQSVGGNFCAELNALAYDPYNGTYLGGGTSPVGGSCPSAGQIRRLTLAGNMVTNEVLLVTLPVASTEAVNALAFDLDGHILAAAGPTVWRVNRWTGAVTGLNVFGFPGYANAIEVSSAGTIYVGALSGGLYILQPNGQVTTIGTMLSATNNYQLNQIALTPDETKLWGCGPGTPSIAEFDLAGPFPSNGVGLPIVPQQLNDVQFDRRTGNAYAVGTPAATGNLWFIDMSQTPPLSSLLGTYPPLGWGLGSQIAVHDHRDRLTVFPRTASAAAGATFEIALGGPPTATSNAIGVIAIVAAGGFPIPAILLALGPYGSPDGRLAVPPIVVPPGLLSPGTITLGFARVVGATVATVNLNAVTVTIVP